jgi:hypothetical protein
MDTNIKPFFSVAIPTYGYNGKGTDFLEFSFEKLKNQSFKDFEIVLSDHSTDETIYGVYLKWKNYFNIKYYKNEVGRGIISPNINNAMKNCEGEWIKILFQDDFLYDNNSLEHQYNFIKSTEKLVWFFSQFYHSNTGYDFYRHHVPHWTDDNWRGNNWLGCPSGLTIKNTDIIYFDENLNWLMDCDYYKRMYINHGEPNILNEITVVNRTWGERLTDTIPQEVRDKEYQIVVQKYA